MYEVMYKPNVQTMYELNKVRSDVRIQCTELCTNPMYRVMYKLNSTRIII